MEYFLIDFKLRSELHEAFGKKRFIEYPSPHLAAIFDWGERAFPNQRKGCSIIIDEHDFIGLKLLGNDFWFAALDDREWFIRWLKKLKAVQYPRRFMYGDFDKPFMKIANRLVDGGLIAQYLDGV